MDICSSFRSSWRPSGPRRGDSRRHSARAQQPLHHSHPDVRKFGRGQVVHYKSLRYIEFMPEFHMTITGKIQKFVMRDQTIGKLGLKTQKTA